jgi:hypothetical protein
MGDVIDRLIEGEPVATLSREDVDAIYTWVNDPRNGISRPLRHLITLLIYELRKAATDGS